MSDNRSIQVLGERIRRIRAEVFGPDGLDELARLSGVPARTWMNYESGVAIPGVMLLKFIDLTAATPSWLLHGEGPVYRDVRQPQVIGSVFAGRFNPSPN